MVKLPEKPMMPRLYDQRVISRLKKTDYGIDEQPRARAQVHHALRSKDPSAELSEPVKPIVYYVDPATPTKWIPWIKKGIEDWRLPSKPPALRTPSSRRKHCRSGGIILGSEDARYSVIRYLPSTIENASRPHVSDPRTGSSWSQTFSTTTT